MNYCSFIISSSASSMNLFIAITNPLTTTTTTTTTTTNASAVKSSLLPPKPLTLFFHHRHRNLFPQPLFSSTTRPTFTNRSQPPASSAEVDMVRNRDGVWSAKAEEKVVVLWDLDNKPPRGPPYDAAVALRRLASIFGTVVDFSAYANRHAFIHVPCWVVDQRRERRERDFLERRGVGLPPEPYVCGVCGRKYLTNLDLKKHFRQLHERERNKKIARMRSLKGKKRRKYRERFVSGNTKYEEAARELITPKSGYGLAGELRRAGVFVKTVADKPQAADAALKRQMQHSMSSGVDWLFLVSDDSDFTETMLRASESRLRTVVVGDWRTALGRQADLWVPWNGVESGEVGEEISRSGGFRSGTAMEGLFSVAVSDLCEEDDTRRLDGVVDEILIGNTGLGRIRISEFSEEDSLTSNRLDDDDFRLYGSSLPGDDVLWDSEDDDDDGYF